jgi:putative transposase
VSPATGQRYPLRMVCEVYRLARSTAYAHEVRKAGCRGTPGKRGPRTAWSDEAIVVAVREVLADRPFHGEGHRKARHLLRKRGMRIGKNRVLRLMRQSRLLVPQRNRGPHGDRSHSGRITTDRPNELWGTDAARFWTRRDGWCWFFGAIDHACEDVVGWHVAKKGDRWAALEPVLQGVREHLAGYAPKIALGLGLRHDWGPQYTADRFLGELRWLGIASTPSYVGEPECNGVMERWIRTLKEECLYLHDFESLEEARQIIAAFIERYNTQWLLERHGYLTPTEARRALLPEAA